MINNLGYKTHLCKVEVSILLAVFVLSSRLALVTSQVIEFASFFMKMRYVRNELDLLSHSGREECMKESGQ